MVQKTALYVDCTIDLHADNPFQESIGEERGEGVLLLFRKPEGDDTKGEGLGFPSESRRPRVGYGFCKV